jgi:hypothetical protein
VPLGLEGNHDMERRGSAEAVERLRLAGQEALASQFPFSKPLPDRESTEDIRENDQHKLQEASSNTYVSRFRQI